MLRTPWLVADIGGTNARFALARCDREGQLNSEIADRARSISIDQLQCFPAEDFETIGDAAYAYLKMVDCAPKVACFAVAGPIEGNDVTLTNSHWRIERDHLRSALCLDHFEIINDFYALAAGIDHLGDDAMLSVRAGIRDPAAPRLIIGPGTGLGQALIVPSRSGPVIVPTEGGHISFAPQTEKESAVFQFIAREHPRVSVERLLSGPGLENIYRALTALADAPQRSLQADDITVAAIAGTDPIAVEAVSMLCEILGWFTGNGVLATGAKGGVVLGGGILPKIRDLFLASAFEAHFLDKGRMRRFVEDVPVQLLTAEGAALYGAADVLDERIGVNS